MRVVVALGGNALLPPGDASTPASGRARVRAACRALAPLAREHELVISHGSGSSDGLLAGHRDDALDLLGAQREGMIGYLVQQELGNELPREVRIATLLTTIEVDGNDPALGASTTTIGPVYTAGEAERLRADRGWTFAVEKDSYRRTVPSPLPRRVFGIEAIETLLESGCVVVCGGSIPTMYVEDELPAGRRLVGVDAVVDKDLAGALLAADLRADALVIATDVDAVYADWGKPTQRAIRRATPTALAASPFAAGSMGSKVRAACSFVAETGGTAAIGSIDDVGALLRREKGTIVTLDARGLELVHAA